MKRIRNSIQCVAYIMLIMLLLLGSLPLSGVFAEVTNTQERTLINETNILENKQEIFDAFADKSVAASKNMELDEKTYGNIIKEEIARINAKKGNSSVLEKAFEEGENENV